MGSDEHVSMQETTMPPRLTAQQELNKRERQRRQRTARAFENIRGLLAVLGYECPNKEQPKVLNLVQQALLQQAVDKGLDSRSSGLENVEATTSSVKCRKRRRADESTESRSSVSPTLEEYAFSNNNLLQVIVGKDCRIVESNKSFREHFHPKDVDVGDSILRLFSVTNHPILKHFISKVLKHSQKRLKNSQSKPFDGILECHATLAGKFPNGHSPPMVNCIISGISCSYAQLSITHGAKIDSTAQPKSDDAYASAVRSKSTGYDHLGISSQYNVSSKMPNHPDPVHSNTSPTNCFLYGRSGMGSPMQPYQNSAQSHSDVLHETCLNVAPPTCRSSLSEKEYFQMNYPDRMVPNEGWPQLPIPSAHTGYPNTFSYAGAISGRPFCYSGVLDQTTEMSNRFSLSLDIARSMNGNCYPKFPGEFSYIGPQ